MGHLLKKKKTVLTMRLPLFKFICDARACLFFFFVRLSAFHSFPLDVFKLLLLSSADLAELCRCLHLLEGPTTKEVDAMIAAADSEDSPRAARDYRSKVDAVTLAYAPLAERILKATEHDSGVFSRLALRDAAKAEKQAIELYSWARTFIPKNATVARDKAAKIMTVPYLVAMAYAVRVKMDVYFVESSGASKSERLEYLERSRKTAEQFTEALSVAVRVVLNGSSLLDMALDYNLVLTTYITLKAAVQANVQMLLKPKDVPQTIALWDDGLSGLR